MPGITRCELIPLPGDIVSIRVDGREAVAWNFAPDLKRPCFFPLVGPDSGESVTRMGHPGAPDHDHHDSVWFAHDKVLGISFWSNESPAFIRQQQWLVYDDGDDSARMAVRLGWFDGHDPQPLLEHDLIAELKPLQAHEFTLALTSLFRPRAETLELQQTNFGFLAVRVARSISAAFGGGRLTGSTGGVGEPALFGKPAAWMDYSGPMAKKSDDGSRTAVEEGVTFFDHPLNPGHPVSWHVRDDGWMGASPCRSGPIVLSRAEPLRLRYLLHVHRGPLDADRANKIRDEWAREPALNVIRSMKPHRHFEIVAE
jgi:hypothetical protein